MDDKQHYLRLGLFVLAALAIMFAVLFILGGRSLFQPSLVVETYFDGSIAGLELGSPVRYRGVPLGTVSAIGVSSAMYERDVPVSERKGYIVVRATITGERTLLWRQELDAYIKRGLRVQTQLAGITGQQFLSVNFFDPAANPPLQFNWQPDYPYIPSVPSLASEIISSVQGVVQSLDKADLEQIGRNLNALVANANQKLEEIPVAQLSADAAALLKDARATVDRIDHILARAPLDQTVQNLASASARLDALLSDPGLKRTVDNTAALTAALRQLADSGELDRIVKNLDRTIQRADAILADNQYDVRGVVRDLRVTSDNLRALSEIVKRYPPGLLLGGPPQKVELPKEPK
jgi:ABC-type transporter Mla subunit MlaD